MCECSAAGTSPALLSPITEPYLLCLNVKCYRDPDGRHYFDLLWQRDLTEHVRYLRDLTLASPCQVGVPPPDAMACDSPLQGIRFVDLPAPDTLLQSVFHLPSIVTKLWREIGRSGMVHLGIAGWPIPLGWVAGPIALLRRKPFLVIVESAPWRLHPAARVGLSERLRAWFFECCGRWCVNHASLVIVTHDEYRRSLLTRNPVEGHVISACWLNDTDLMSDAGATQAWRDKQLLGGQKLRVLFAGRLVPAKGLNVLLDAMGRLHQENAAVELDILGEGDLHQQCCELASSLNRVTRVRMLGTVPYGESFFRLLSEYHAVAVPSLSDEQPRVVYDAFSQAVPVLASRTSGLRASVEEGRTGMFTAANDGKSWAELLRWSLHNTNELERMGMAGLQVARGMTIRKMHERRWLLLTTVRREGGNIP